MSGYSSIFSSGLLATPRPNAYSDHSTLSNPDSPVNMDSDPDTTPTKLNTLPIPSSDEAMNYFMPRSRASSNASATSALLSAAPRLRRRRSSLSVANNGLAAVKTPQRNAGIALQRNSLMVPGGLRIGVEQGRWWTFSKRELEWHDDTVSRCSSLVASVIRT